jgi:O-antigen ligase
MAWRDGGSIAAVHWLPYAVLVALVLAVVLLSGAAVRPGRLAASGVAALLALALWVALTVSWSAVPTLAREEALLTGFYAVVFALPLVTLRSATERAAAAAVVTGLLVALILAAAVELQVAGAPEELFDSGRLFFPVSYPNAQAAICLVAFWPAVALAARPSFPAVARALAVGGATALLAGWLLAQSKGGAVALAVSAIVFFAVCPQRLRALVPAAIAGALAALASGPLTEPYRADSGELVGAIQDAGATLLLAFAAAAVLGLLYALADRYVDVPARLHRVLGIAVLVALAAALGAGAAVFYDRVDDPRDWASDRWASFKRLPEEQTGTTHLLSLGSNRYDFWRVALGELREHPIGGIGARGFAPAYLLERRSEETPARAHSLEVDALSETGIVGGVLLAVALGLPLAAVARRSHRSLLAAGLLAAGVYWLVHVSGDWIWTFPAVTVPLFLFLGIGASGDGERPLDGRAGLAAGIGAAALAVLVLVPPWLSSRFVERAYASPADASSPLRWARRLDPLSTAPLLAEADLARGAAAIPPLERAVEKEPRRVDLRLRLGLAYLDAGRRAEARRELVVAARLFPGDPEVGRALRRAR